MINAAVWLIVRVSTFVNYYDRIFHLKLNAARSQSLPQLDISFSASHARTVITAKKIFTSKEFYIILMIKDDFMNYASINERDLHSRQFFCLISDDEAN